MVNRDLQSIVPHPWVIVLANHEINVGVKILDDFGLPRFEVIVEPDSEVKVGNVELELGLVDREVVSRLWRNEVVLLLHDT